MKNPVQHLKKETRRLFAASATISVCTAALVVASLSVWAIGYQAAKGYLHPTVFSNAPGTMKHAWVHDFEKGAAPCGAASGDGLFYKEIDENKTIYSCARWWPDNVIVLVGNALFEGGSLYYEISSTRPSIDKMAAVSH